MTILADTQALGQQIWLDNLSRSLIQSGTLADFLAQGISGVTSNPAIFQKAFASDDLYLGEIESLKQQSLSPKAIYETLAIADVRAACDVCLAQYEKSGQNAGFVSLEVSPEWANDAEQTVAEACRLYVAIDRPNAMIKVPATDAGILAMKELIASGISVNLTLLFSRKQTLKAYDAYSDGLQQRLSNGKSVENIRMVASFFISRIDSALDAILPHDLQGKVAIASAKCAYADWQDYFAAEKWHSLEAQKAKRPSLLWASTGVKNPEYPSTLYVDQLIGENTVNTIPEATLKAFLSEGTATLTLAEKMDEAKAVIAQTETLGIDLETLASRLQNDGLKQFEDAFDKLLQALV